MSTCNIILYSRCTFSQICIIDIILDRIMTVVNTHRSSLNSESMCPSLLVCPGPCLGIGSSSMFSWMCCLHPCVVFVRVSLPRTRPLGWRVSVGSRYHRLLVLTLVHKPLDLQNVCWCLHLEPLWTHPLIPSLLHLKNGWRMRGSSYLYPSDRITDGGLDP